MRPVRCVCQVVARRSVGPRPDPIVARTRGGGRAAFPPSEAPPGKGLVDLVCPLCFVYATPAELYVCFREMWARHWCKLQTVSSAPGTLLPLLRLFETLLQECALGALGAHAHMAHTRTWRTRAKAHTRKSAHAQKRTREHSNTSARQPAPAHTNTPARTYQSGWRDASWVRCQPGVRRQLKRAHIRFGAAGPRRPSACTCFGWM